MLDLLTLFLLVAALTMALMGAVIALRSILSRYVFPILTKAPKGVDLFDEYAPEVCYENNFVDRAA